MVVRHSRRDMQCRNAVPGFVVRGRKDETHVKGALHGQEYDLPLV